jgi:hypothetical protein
MGATIERNSPRNEPTPPREVRVTVRDGEKGPTYHCTVNLSDPSATVSYLIQINDETLDINDSKQMTRAEFDGLMTRNQLQISDFIEAARPQSRDYAWDRFINLLPDRLQDRFRKL